MVWSPPVVKVVICNCTVPLNYLLAKRHWLPFRISTPVRCGHSTIIHSKRICWHPVHPNRTYWYGIWTIRPHQWRLAPKRNHLRTYRTLRGIVKCSTFWRRCSVRVVSFGIYAKMSRSSNWAIRNRVYVSVHCNGIRILQLNCGSPPRTTKHRSSNCGIYGTPLLRLRCVLHSKITCSHQWNWYILVFNFFATDAANSSARSLRTYLVPNGYGSNGLMRQRQ